MGTPLVVVETPGARDAATAEIEGAGWALTRSGRPRPGEVWDVEVGSVETAGAAVLAAVRGCGLLVLAPRELAADLAVDLRGLGTVHYRDDTALTLDTASWAVLHAVARGNTVEAAARALHLSTRTAERRLAAAQRRLGAASLAAAVARLGDADRIAPAPG